LLSEIKKESKFIDPAEDGFDYSPAFHLGSFTMGFHPSFQAKPPLGEGGTRHWCRCFLRAPSPAQPKPSSRELSTIPSPSPALDRHLPIKTQCLRLPPVPVIRKNIHGKG